jgi:hypothetical protein
MLLFHNHPVLYDLFMKMTGRCRQGLVFMEKEQRNKIYAVHVLYCRKHMVSTLLAGGYCQVWCRYHPGRIAIGNLPGQWQTAS